MFASNKSAAPSGKLFVEDVFSTYLYTGNGGTQTITNGIDLAGKGGLVWLKERTSTGNNPDHWLFDTLRGGTTSLTTNSSGGNFSGWGPGVTFNSNGFGIGNIQWNTNASSYASWTFREAPKFFDIVTYTGNGVAGRQIAHNLGVAPGMMIVKQTSGAQNWAVYHRSQGPNNALFLDLTNAATGSDPGYWNFTNPSATTFTVGNYSSVNANGATYVAYLYAHDTASTGLIQCGSYTGNGATVGPVINLGWEPQWILVKDATATDGFGNWLMFDNMRGWPVGSNGQQLLANSSSAEGAVDRFVPTATGFNVTNGYSQSNVNGNTYIYMAIRRPMKTPTLGTSVFSPIRSTRAAGGTNTTGFPVDMQILGDTSQIDSNNWTVVDRLRKVSTTPDDNSSPGLKTSATSAEATSNASKNWSSTGFETPFFFPSVPAIYYSFRRAPGFFDEVCYTGTGANRTINHNLGVAPELMIVKRRDSAAAWYVYATPIGTNAALFLNLTNAATSPAPTIWNDTAPTATVFTVGTAAPVNGSGGTFVNYLFASAPGVSKVGSYTGNGSSQTINCGFAAGARFVMIKRTDSTGDWYVWDTARGIVAANDPHLSLNTTAAEVTTDDTIDTNSSGFVVNQDAATNVNVNAATYIFLAIA